MLRCSFGARWRSDGLAFRWEISMIPGGDLGSLLGLGGGDDEGTKLRNVLMSCFLQAWLQDWGISFVGWAEHGGRQPLEVLFGDRTCCL